jgi:hypothetical protein
MFSANERLIFPSVKGGALYSTAAFDVKGL